MNTNNAHTPGPWNTTRRSSGGHDIITSDVSPVDVCVISKSGKSPQEIAANIRLIGAAPELLEALGEILAICEHGSVPSGKSFSGEIARKAARAIAKATGGAP